MADEPRELALVSLDTAQNRLALIWISGSAVIIALLALQSLLGRYDSHAQDAWGWLLPNLMPTLTMILAVLGYTALNRAVSATVVRATFLTVAVAISVFYLLLVVVTIAIQPFAAHDAQTALGLMRMSNLWLGPIQGLSSSALGVLFVSKEKR